MMNPYMMNPWQQIPSLMVKQFVNTGFARDCLNAVPLFQRYFHISDLLIGDDKSLDMVAHLNGLHELLQLRNVHLYFGTDNEGNYMKFLKIDCPSSSGLHNLIQDYIVGKRLEMPDVTRLMPKDFKAAWPEPWRTYYTWVNGGMMGILQAALGYEAKIPDTTSMLKK